ncbi:MAG: ATP synthase F1 subunit delta [Deltaproteobacteria bacterium]|nr:ATP synthase F1 subunit delta [Deltaproteobacteria bacterium]
MMNGSLPRRYARAVFSLAQEGGRLGEYVSCLEGLGKIFVESSIALETMAESSYSRADRLKILEEILKKVSIPLLLKNFLFLLVHKERFSLFPQICREFFSLRDEVEGVIRIQVYSPKTPTEEDLRSIETLLSTRLRKKIKASAVESPELIGGMMVRVGETLYDGSIKRDLERMKKAMLERSFN